MSRQNKQIKKLTLARELSRVRKGGGKTGRTECKHATRSHRDPTRVKARTELMVAIREAKKGLPW